MAQKTSFKYAPLDLTRPGLRLLRLKASGNGTLKRKRSTPAEGPRIECELIGAFFDAGFVPDYEAVSYTWGSTDDPREICLNGSKFLVTYNLWSLLQDIRYRSMDRILWIDAICIDQANDRERGHQVHQMDQIYRCAERVIVWLGSLTEPISALMDCLGDLQKRMPGLEWAPTDIRWQLNWEHIKRESRACQKTLSSGFMTMIHRPWFRRGWILQEVANARVAVVYCGHKSVSARIFALYSELTKVAINPHCQAVIDIMPGPSRKGSWWSRERDFLTLLKRFNATEATREHDRIFALLGLCPEANDKIPVDYEMSIPDLIRETLSFIFKCNIDCLTSISYSTVRSLLGDLRRGIVHNRVLEGILRQSSTDSVETFLMEHSQSLSLTRGLIQGAMENKRISKGSLETILNLKLSPVHWSRNETGQGIDRTDRTMMVHRNFMFLNKRIDRSLLIASIFGNEACVQKLLDLGAYTDHGNDSLSDALTFASEQGHEAVVELLLSRGANCHSQTAWGGNSLTLASRQGHEKIVRLLLDGGADPNPKTELNRPLLLAAAEGHEAIVRLLLDRGADIEARDKGGETPLLKASRIVHKATIQLLLDRGADYNSVSYGYNYCDGKALPQYDGLSNTALIQASRFGRLDIVQLLLDRGADCDQTNEYGSTPLLSASRHGRSKVVRLLLDQGTDPNTKNDFSETPLLWAQAKGHEVVIEMLMKSGSLTAPK